MVLKRLRIGRRAVLVSLVAVVVVGSAALMTLSQIDENFVTIKSRSDIEFTIDNGNNSSVFSFFEVFSPNSGMHPRPFFWLTEDGQMFMRGRATIDISHKSGGNGREALWLSGSPDNVDVGIVVNRPRMFVWSTATNDRADFIVRNIQATGTISKAAGSFKIDHPLDPANKYLSHSFVESPDMKNVYDGVTMLDEDGEAWVELPEWFEALNTDSRYQLTAVGAPMPNLYIAEEISHNRFKIAGGQAGKKVSWQVTGIRHDPYANAYRIPVEEEKSEAERGFYLHPELYGQLEVQRIR